MKGTPVAGTVTATGTPGDKGRTSHTPRLDERLAERLRTDRGAFERSTRRNALVGGLLLVAGLGLLYLAFGVVGIAHGGVAVAIIALFPILLSLTAFAEVRWRRRLLSRTLASHGTD